MININTFSGKISESLIYKDRGRKETIVLFPGWAMDYRIFDSLDIDFNYLIVRDFSCYNMDCEISDFAKNKGLDSVTLLGHSLGGFIAAQFSYSYPHLSDKTILIGVREKYKEQELERSACMLKRNKKVYLNKFYSQCFCRKATYLNLKKDIFQDYMNKFGIDSLLSGLDYLSRVRMDIEKLKLLNNVLFIHGVRDQIAPVSEVVEMKSFLPKAKFNFIENSGHIPFLESNIFYDW